jgi:hypothetical protein
MIVPPDPVLYMVAAEWEARGLTSPDKHDMIVAQFGQLVRLAEIGQAPDQDVEMRYSEIALPSFEYIFRELPADHGLGLVNILLGQGATFDLLQFLTQQAKVKNFSVTSLTASRTAKQIFEGFFLTLTGEANLQ